MRNSANTWHLGARGHVVLCTSSDNPSFLAFLFALMAILVTWHQYGCV